MFSVETRKGLFSLAQMSRNPFVLFFDRFCSDNRWDNAGLEGLEPLFCVSVTKQFLKQSRIEKQKHVQPLTDFQIPDRWIHPSANMSRRLVARGTPLERQAYLPNGASLVLKDVMGHTGGPYRHRSGVFDELLVPSLSSADDEFVEQHQTTSLGVFPALNERLYLCHLIGRRVSPWADLVLDRPIPETYSVYLDIVFPKRPSSATEQAALRALFI